MCDMFTGHHQSDTDFMQDYITALHNLSEMCNLCESIRVMIQRLIVVPSICRFMIIIGHTVLQFMYHGLFKKCNGTSVFLWLALWNSETFRPSISSQHSIPLYM